MRNSKIKTTLFKTFRMYAMKIITNNLGDVVEDDEKLICYVKRSKLKKANYNFSIFCKGAKRNEEIAKTYKLNKPILYVFEGLKFNERVYIYGDEDCEIIIKDCEFDFNLSGTLNGKCTLENIDIPSYSSLSLSAKNFTMKNIKIKDSYILKEDASSLFVGGIDSLNIINSIIERKTSNISLICNREINLINTKIIGKEVTCKTNEMISDKKSLILGEERVNLENIKNFDKINIKSPLILHNGSEFLTNGKTVVFEKLKEPLHIKRVQLIELLKGVLNKCEENNALETTRYKDSLNEQSISNALSKKNYSKGK